LHGDQRSDIRYAIAKEPVDDDNKTRKRVGEQQRLKGQKAHILQMLERGNHLPESIPATTGNMLPI
jgi:hypothetical protein